MNKKIFFGILFLLIFWQINFAYSQPDTMWTKQGGFSYAVFFDNFTKVAGSGSDLHIYDALTGKQTFTKHVGLIYANGIINGKELLFLNIGSNTISSYDVNNDQFLSNYIDTTLPFPDYKNNVWTLSPNNVDFCQKLNYLAICYVSGLIGTNDSNRIKINIYDLNTNKLIKSILIFNAYSYIIKFSHEGKNLTIAYQSFGNDYVQIFDTQTFENLPGNIIKTNHSTNYNIVGLSVSPNGKYAVTSSQDGSLEVIDFINHNIHKTYYPNPSRPTTSTFINDSILLMGFDEEISLTNIYSGQIYWTYPLKSPYYGPNQIDYDSINDRILLSDIDGIALLKNIMTSVPIQNPVQEMSTLYPNPVNNTVTIPLSNKIYYSELQINDITGKIIQDIHLTPQINSSGSISISVNNLSPGIYFINLISPKSIQTYKMIKEK